ncbi:PH domain-containing protein [Microbacter sp. GSS18]|nr:PH domain-containing protein [Microbacter sp. GSS18]
MLDPRIDKHLIADQGEKVVDEVRKHWAAIAWAVLELIGGVIVLAIAAVVPPQAWWVPAVIGLLIILHASVRILEQRVDRFVITNMRVFRVHGILAQNIATMPLARILDISVHKPIIGRVFGYGHFVFESAAQEQGLREIRFVGRPDERGLTIQRVIAQAGLRGLAARQAMGEAPITPPEQERSAPPAPATPAREAAAYFEQSQPRGWDWLAHAQQREEERLAELRGDHVTGVIVEADPDRTTTAPIELPRSGGDRADERER